MANDKMQWNTMQCKSIQISLRPTSIPQWCWLTTQVTVWLWTEDRHSVDIWSVHENIFRSESKNHRIVESWSHQFVESWLGPCLLVLDELFCEARTSEETKMAAYTHESYLDAKLANHTCFIQRTNELDVKTLKCTVWKRKMDEELIATEEKTWMRIENMQEYPSQFQDFLSNQRFISNANRITIFSRES